jgi:predicted RNA-binding protein YlxR (DUF448 family)
MSPPPHRSCAGCGCSREKQDLLRLTISGGSARVDPRGRLPGRGVYLCRDEACVALAERRRALGRWVGAEAAREAFAAARSVIGAPGADQDVRLLALVGMARRAGAIETGLRSTLAGLGRGEGKLLVLARDIATRGALVATRAAREAGVPHLTAGTRVALGESLGIGETVAALVLDERLAKAIIDLAAAHSAPRATGAIRG